MVEIEMSYWCRQAQQKFGNRTKVMFHIIVPVGYSSWDQTDDYNLDLDHDSGDRAAIFMENGSVAVINWHEGGYDDEEEHLWLDKTSVIWRYRKNQVECYDLYSGEWLPAQPFITDTYKDLMLNKSIERQLRKGT